MPEQLPLTQSLTFSFICGLQFSSSQITRHTYTYTLSVPPPTHTYLETDHNSDSGGISLEESPLHHSTEVRHQHTKQTNTKTQQGYRVKERKKVSDRRIVNCNKLTFGKSFSYPP